MSGVEVAGFALAAFPLLISALEHYREGWEIMGDFWKIRKEYKKCQQDLKLQKLVFEENLEQLLGNLVSDEDVLTALIAKPGGYVNLFVSLLLSLIRPATYLFQQVYHVLAGGDL